MAMTDTQRTTLYTQLTHSIGQEAARTLMEQLPPSGWDQVATKEDLKASEKLLQRELKASEKLLHRELKTSEKLFLAQLKESEGRLLIQIAESERRQGTRIDETNTRLNETNRELSDLRVEVSDLRVEVRTGFADLQIMLAKHMRWMAAVLLGFAVAMAVPVTVALL